MKHPFVPVIIFQNLLTRCQNSEVQISLDRTVTRSFATQCFYTSSTLHRTLNKHYFVCSWSVNIFTRPFKDEWDLNFLKFCLKLSDWERNSLVGLVPNFPNKRIETWKHIEKPIDQKYFKLFSTSKTYLLLPGTEVDIDVYFFLTNPMSRI